MPERPESTPTRVIAGIDEAGYGPRLGPLVIGCAVFRAPTDNADGTGPVDLWRALHPTVVRSGAKSDTSRIPIDDSKKLKLANTSPNPLVHLERGILPSLGLLDRKPSTGAELLEALGIADQPADNASSASPASTALTGDQIDILTNALRRAMRVANIDLLGLTCASLDAGRFNQALTELGPKSEVSFSAVGRFLRGIWKRWGAESPMVAVDRQGGRKRYGGPLAGAIPGVIVTPVTEGETVSVYEIESRDTAPEKRRMTVRFEVSGDDHHLPIALASMAAKLVRERLMMRFNEHWASRAPQVRPTAGYGLDARRWINEIRPLISEDELRALVRRA